MQTPIETEKTTSWKTKLTSLRVNGTLPVAFKYSNTVKNAIWHIKKMSTMEFKTSTDGDVMTVRRTA